MFTAATNTGKLPGLTMENGMQVNVVATMAMDAAVVAYASAAGAEGDVRSAG
jgi:hypothetical protein